MHRLYCQELGLVSALAGSREAQRIVVTATVTAIDMISNIGGILGLFSGVSVLSLAEAIYWAGKFVSKKLFKEEAKKKKKREIRSSVLKAVF